jgi:tripartite-type tricarboxylate transporter receptor subunit TctC
MHHGKITAFAALLAGAAAFMPASDVQAQAWQPTRSVEFVVTAGAGGGTDIFARTIQSIIQKHNLMDQPIVVTLKGGGSGAEGFMYGKSGTGDAHRVVFGTSNQYLLPLVTKVGWKRDELTPVAAMALDEFVLWTRADAPWKTASEYVAAAKANTLKMGGSQSKDLDQTLVRIFEKAAGIKVNYIPFRSGGEAAVQLAGGHIDSNTNNPAENVGQWKGGQARPICVFAPERLAAGPKVTETMGWSDIPTCSEQGVSVSEYRMPRVVYLPGGVPPEAVKFWEGVLQKAFATPEWREYIERTSQTGRFLAGKDLATFIDQDEARQRGVFQDEGWLVN